VARRRQEGDNRWVILALVVMVVARRLQRQTWPTDRDHPDHRRATTTTMDVVERLALVAVVVVVAVALVVVATVAVKAMA
jgi:hypothetical protein